MLGIKRPSPATVIASLALLVALAGTSVAAVSIVIPKNSVGTLQLKNNAVVSSKVKNGSLLAVDFKPGQLPKGPAGPAGPAGAAGAKGDTGAPGISGFEIIQGSTKSGSGSHSATVACPSGKTAIGGGYGTGTPGSAGVGITTATVLSDKVAYRVDGVYLGSGSWNLVPYVYCANVAP